MTKSKWQRLFAALLVTTLLTATVASAAMAAVPAAVLQQDMGASEVTGIIPGGEFAKIWLGLTPKEPGTVTVRAEWDRNNVDSNGVGFYVLDESNLSAVLSGNAVRENNIAAGSQTFYLNGPDNTQGAAFRAVGPAYTVVIFNDSNSDASFTMSVENGTLTDDSGQVTLVGVATEEATEAPAADGADTAEADATAEAAATVDATTEATVEATAVATATVAATPAGPLRAQDVAGELPEQFDQHLLGLEPGIRDGEVTLVLTFDPQDSSELARRINFWVLDAAGLRAYQEGESASSVAIAAGSREEGNTRTGTFQAAGLGPYTVIVYNNSMVPATYGLRVDGGVLVDDSNQTLTAQEASVGATSVVTTTADATGEDTATVPATTTTTTTTDAAGREGEPGGTYTVQSGDTLALIARDIYGDYRVYEQICAVNDIADCNVIEVGQVLQLPTEAEAGASATATTTTTTATTTDAATATAVAEETEEVTAGDTVTATTTVTSTGTTTGTTTSGTTSSTTTSSTSAGGTIVDVAAGNASFTTLVAALQETGLDEALSGSGPYTVFAPTDAAFDALLTGNGLTVEQLLRARELPDILQYHVLSSKLLAADITDGLQATTLEGKPVTFEVKDGKVFINGAEIITTDVEGSNGVIHGIDAVILPPQ